MGLSDLVKFNLWRLVSVDPEVVLELEAQADPPEGVTVQRPPVVAGGGSPGSTAPAVQWVAGGSQQLRISDAFWSKHFGDDISAKITVLDRLVSRDATLGRAPLVEFTWASVSLRGYVTGQYRIVGFWVTGLPKGVVFELTVTEAPSLALSTGSPSGETLYVVGADGELFESLGLRYFGDPLKGELIRRVNPDLAAARTIAGERVKVLEREHPSMRESIVPTAPCFLDRRRQGTTWQPVVEDLCETRGVTSVGRPWALLEEVASGEVG